MKQPAHVNRKLLDYVKRQTTRAGYLLELEVADAIKRLNWLPRCNQYFFDQEERKGREIDIVAWPGEIVRVETALKQEEQMEPFVTTYEVPIECKKSDEYCWVFFARRRSYIDAENLGQVFDRRLSEHEVPIVQEDDFHSLGLHYLNYPLEASAYAEIRISQNAHDPVKHGKQQIFDAAIKLMKYVGYSFERTHHWLGVDKSSQIVQFNFPVIVFDGSILAETVSRGEVEVTETDRILLRGQYQPSYSRLPKDFLIDVVKRKNLPSLLKTISSDMQRIDSYIMSNREKLLRQLASGSRTPGS